MSDTPAETPEPELPASDTETPPADDASAGAAPSTPRVGIHSLLTRDSDQVARPGFRNPSNTRSKAQASAKRDADRDARQKKAARKKKKQSRSRLKRK